MATHRENFLKKHGLPPSTSLSLAQMAMLSGVPLSILEEVAKRGRGAAVSNLASVRLKKDFSKNPDTKKYPASARLHPVTWGLARAYSFLQKGKTYYTADSDLAKKLK